MNGKILSRDINRRIGQAMHTYDMLADSDRVLIAVSGGIDSLVLAWLLDFWRTKAPITYDIHAVHIDLESDGASPGQTARAVRRELNNLGIPLEILPADWQPAGVAITAENSGTKDICYKCARHRRRQLFDHARLTGCNKIALGHHRDDIIETFFLNICYAGNISTMVPKQELFDGRLALIRPLSFLDKSEISLIGDSLEISPVRSACPLGEQTRRRDIRLVLEQLYHTHPEARSRIFAALANVRTDYLLKPVGGERDRNGQGYANGG